MKNREPWGYFNGPITVKWSIHDPRVNILSGLGGAYIDKHGRRWEAGHPEIIRRPGLVYVGKHRRAMAFHEVACRQRIRSSKAVHRMLYEAMRCDEVGAVKAWFIWTIVRLFGPRFKAKQQLCACRHTQLATADPDRVFGRPSSCVTGHSADKETGKDMDG